MSTANHPLAGSVPALDAQLARRTVIGLMLFCLAVGMGVGLSAYPPPSMGLILVGGLGLMGMLALAVARFEAAVALGFLLLGVVVIEPAPVDAVFAIVLAIALVTGRFDISRVPRSVGAVLAVFLSITVLSMIEVIDPVRGTLFVTITLYLAIFSVWFTGYLDSERKARTVFIAYLVAAVVSALLGVLALYGPLPAKDLFLYDPSRAQALFQDPNVFGPFLVPPALVLLGEMMNPRLLRIRFSFKAALFVVLALGVVVSFSRAAWLNLALGVAIVLLVVALRRGGSMRALALLATILTAGAVVGGVLAVTGSVDFISERAGIQRYDTERFSSQREGIQIAANKPIGVGPGQFDVLVPVATHSTYVRVLSEQGFLGLMAWLALALTTLVLAARNAILGRDTYGISSAALLAAWCGILANSFFVDTLHWRHLWVIAPLIWAGAMRRPGASRPSAAQSA